MTKSIKGIKGLRDQIGPGSRAWECSAASIMAWRLWDETGRTNFTLYKRYANYRDAVTIELKRLGYSTDVILQWHHYIKAGRKDPDWMG